LAPPGVVARRSDFPKFAVFFVLESLLFGMRALSGGSATQQMDCMSAGSYALIAARSGWTPMMFMTRVRL
jgi:hypothetical protein